MATFVKERRTNFCLCSKKKQLVLVEKMKMQDENTKMMSRYSLNLDNMMKLVGEFSIIDQKMYS
jgi:ABC-type sugar transport system ATPase subunit